jgi:hypothetical protein
MPRFCPVACNSASWWVCLCYFYKESYMQARMGKNYTTGSALFQAFDRVVIQLICRLFPGTSSSLWKNSPNRQPWQGVCWGPCSLPLWQCPHQRNSAGWEGQTVPEYHDLFELTAVKKKSVKVKKPMKFVFGYVTLWTLVLFLFWGRRRKCKYERAGVLDLICLVGVICI